MVTAQRYSDRVTGFTKLFSSILSSTIWCEPSHVKVAWITLLAMCDRHGLVEASVPGLAKMAGLSVDETRDAVARLEAPDPDSRTKDRDGRRLAPVDGGWLVLNYLKYRNRIDEDAQRIATAERVRRYRAKTKKIVTPPVTVTVGNAEKRQAEAEAEAEAEADLRETTSLAPSPPEPGLLAFPCDGLVKSWSLTQGHLDKWTKAFPSVDLLGECRKALVWIDSHPHKRKTARGMPAFLTRWFGNTQDRGHGSSAPVETAKERDVKAFIRLGYSREDAERMSLEPPK